MLSYSEFIVGLWFFPVILCILTPLALLGIWTIKRMLEEILMSVRRVERTIMKKVVVYPDYHSNSALPVTE